MQRWRTRTGVSFRWGRNNNLGRAAVRVMQPGWSLTIPHTDAAQPLNHDQGCQKWKHGAVSRTSQGRARDTGETGQIGRPSQMRVNVRVHFVTGSRGRWWKHLKQQSIPLAWPRIGGRHPGSAGNHQLAVPALSAACRLLRCVAQEDRRLGYQNEQYAQGGTGGGHQK